MTSYHELNLPDYEQLVECPYNKAHQILKHRLQFHLIKCRRSNQKVKLLPCRYNSVHIYPEPELKAHEEVCENRIDVLRFLYDNGDKKKSKSLDVPKPPIPSILLADNDEESWDNDEDVPSYNPRETCAKSNVIQHIQHMTPSQREAVRRAERERLKEFQK